MKFGLNVKWLKDISVWFDFDPVVSRWIARFGLGLLIVTAGMSYWEAKRFMRADKWRAHSEVVLDHVQDQQLAIRTAESAVYRFILLPRPEFLTELVQAEKSAGDEIELLAQMVQDNPDQSKLVEQIKKNVRARIAYWDRLVELLQSKREAEAKTLMLGTTGPELRASLKEIIDQFLVNENILLHERTTNVQRDYEYSVWVVSASLILSFALLFFVTQNLRAENAKRAQVERDLVIAKQRAEEASDLKSRFLANMSHEIRTPLNGIIGMTRLLEKTTVDAKQADFLDTIKVSSNALLALINQILDISKIESGKLQLEEAPFELHSLVSSTISVVAYGASSKGLRIELQIASDVPEFYLGDALRLRQVLLNLLHNAIKFSDHGVIKIEIRKLSEADSAVRLCFAIIDQGVGLDPSARQHLFQAFAQGDSSTSRKYGGTGLGLSISKQIVEMMGGQIDFESKLGQGSRFFFEIEIKPSKFTNADYAANGASQSLGTLSGHVLIAEDNRMNQKVIQEMVSSLGCTFQMVQNGIAAQAALAAAHFDVVLMDGQMPEMDGYEATQNIRAGKAGPQNLMIPIIATTANAIKGDIEKCMRAGMNDYVAKPISLDDLTYKLGKWLQRGRDVLDLASVQRIDDLGKRGKTDLRGELIKIFAEDRETAFRSLREHLAQNDLNSIAKIAHSLKSAAANLGALRVRDVAERIEKAKLDGSTEHVEWLLDSLQTEYDMALTALRQLPLAAYLTTA